MKLSRKAVTFDSLRLQREIELMDVDIHASPQLPQLDEHSRQRRAYSIPRWDIIMYIIKTNQLCIKRILNKIAKVNNESFPGLKCMLSS